MSAKRIKHLFNLRRLRRCRELFPRPLRTFIGLSFVLGGYVPVALNEGATLRFTRRKRDHKFWDWFLDSPVPLQFTEDGLMRIEYEGVTLFLRPGSTDFAFFNEVFLHDIYEVRSSSRQFETVVDLGANVGLFTCAALERANRVVSVEAVSENHMQAVRNITANAGDVEDLLHAAVAPRSGETVRIHHHPDNTGAHSVSPGWERRPNEHESSELVDTITLEDLLRGRNISTVDLLKCDIEGAEYDVFAATSDDQLSRINEIVMEVHISLVHPPQQLRDLVARLHGCGFTVKLQREIPEAGVIDSFVLAARR